MDLEFNEQRLGLSLDGTRAKFRDKNDADMSEAQSRAQLSAFQLISDVVERPPPTCHPLSHSLLVDMESMGILTA